MPNQTECALTTHTESTQGVSVRERSTSDLMKAIHSPGDDGYILDRARTVVMGLYFDPDRTPEQRAATLEEFRRALTIYPKWAVAGAFDDWVRTRTRRPSPAEIGILASARMKPLTDEISWRRERQTEDADADHRERVTPARAAEIMAEFGFSPTADERQLSDTDDRQRHWSETSAPDDTRWAGLKKARAQNPLMRAAGGQSE